LALYGGTGWQPQEFPMLTNHDETPMVHIPISEIMKKAEEALKAQELAELGQERRSPGR